MAWQMALAQMAMNYYDKRRQEKQQDTRDRTFVQTRVRDAQAAGISPLAALGAGGYSSSSAPSGGGGLMSGVSRLVENLQVDNQRAQLDKTRAETDSVRLANEKMRGEILQNRLGKLREAAVGANAPAGSTGYPTGNLLKRERVVTPIGSINAEGGTTNIDDLQSRYGEASDVLGVINLINDVNFLNARKFGKGIADWESAARRRQRSKRADIFNPPRKQRPRQLPWD